MILLLNVALGACFLAFAVARTLRYMLYFQQDEYDGKRFLHWIAEKRVFDMRLSAVLLALGVLAFVPVELASEGTKVLAGAALLLFAFLDRQAGTTAKKKLVLTARVKRILMVATVLQVVLAIAAVLLGAHPLLWLLLVQLIPPVLVGAKMLLDPQEKRVQARFRAEAERKLAAVDPKIVAITGSFGKTSVKHILGHVLGLTSNTVYTPGSVNTVMGIVRVIREKLTDDTQNFIVEMGAYGPGSINRLCHLTPPDFGIITALGAAHYERFKTLDSVARAKFELAEHTLARGGRVAIAEQVLSQPYAAAFVEAHREQFIIVGEGENCDVRITESAQTPRGTRVTLVSKNAAPLTLDVPLLGPAHAKNIALAFASAEALGVPHEAIALALRTTPPITHRLEIKTDASGATLIDDAYNSNPDGFSAALDVLDMLGKDRGGRRILVTPGMVELGARHDEAHTEVGSYAAGRADVVLAVAPQRIPTFLSALRRAGGPEVREVKSFTEARSWLAANLQTSDVLLIENDLPDMYEAVPRL